MTEVTHIVIRDGALIVSPNLMPVISFLQGIEKEIKNLLGLDQRISAIRGHYLSLLDLVQFLAGKLKENGIDFEYKIERNPEELGEILNAERPPRAEMIVLFAHLEVLLCLDTAYARNTANDDEIRSAAMAGKAVKKFLKKYCLTPENDWGRKNPDRLRRIDVDGFRKLRNALTHFFSVGHGIGITHARLDEKARRLESAVDFRARFLSPEDLFEIAESAASLMIQRWAKDCDRGREAGSVDFETRILKVREVVARNGAMIVKENDINI